MSADNTALGFRAPRIFLPPSSGFTLPNSVHCLPDLKSEEELSFPQNRLPPSASAGLGLTPAGPPFIGGFPVDSAASQRDRWPRPYAGWFPLYRRFSSAPDTFLLPSRASDLHWTFLFCLSTGAFIYPSPLSWECSLSLVMGSRMSPQMFCLMSESPSGKREGFRDNAIHKREVYY